MKILIIEDNESTVRAICDYVDDNEWEYKLCGFKEAREQVAIMSPEIIIMDWMFDAEAVNEGEPIFQDVYEKNFTPVIIFSAVAETINLPDYIRNTPLIKVVQKGDEQDVIDLIKKWKDYIIAVRNLRCELNKSLVSSVKAIGNFMKMSEYPGDEVVKHMLNKRVTYFFDKDFVEECMPAWVQYEYPPIQNNLLVADVLRVCSETMDIKQPGNPEEYRVVLTPSCDMARPKSGQLILVATCHVANSFSDDAKLKKGETILDKSAQDKKEKLIRSLNTGYNYARVALPILPNKIPYMTINLKSIEQIPIGEIALSEDDVQGKKYYRVASMVSPYREQIVWAHMINSCRPGMPDRNMEEWAEGIMVQ